MVVFKMLSFTELYKVGARYETVCMERFKIKDKKMSSKFVRLK